MIKTNYNPDVLNCLANLSSDEVFTPPKLVNEMLDMLPQELFSDPDTKFLDPVCKTGVFLREIAKRLDKGLEKIIPEKQKRIDHILTNQLFGIAITEITSLLSRRSVYCSKKANGKYSICQSFDDVAGNIRFKITSHKWQKGRCIYCGANKKNYKRSSDLETHAYEFIHTQKPEEIFNMKFDVIIGNPPYQLNDGGGSNKISAKPIYNAFINQAKKLNPRFLVMIIPSRWFAGGKGLNSFRQEMLNDKRIKYIIDYPKSRECFPGVDIAGGVCYFLWDREYSDDCEIITRIGNMENRKIRKLNEFSIFVRDNIGIGIIHKIINFNEKTFNNLVLPRNSFGFTTSDRGKPKNFEKSIKLISSDGVSYIDKKNISKNNSLVEKYKVSIGTLNPDRAGVNNASDGKMNVTTKVKLLFPNEIVTETYIIIGCFNSKDEAINCVRYIRTKLTRFLISLTLTSMHIVRDNFQFVPIQDFSETWTDEKLYKKYGLNEEEIAYIESKIRPMENGDE